jgi:hypothetical protein
MAATQKQSHRIPQKSEEGNESIGKTMKVKRIRNGNTNVSTAMTGKGHSSTTVSEVICKSYY